MSKELALIIGAAVAVLNGIVTVAGLGAFDDGFQAADLIPILAPLIGALGIRQGVWSQDSVDNLRRRLEARAKNEAAGGTTLRSAPASKKPGRDR